MTTLFHQSIIQFAPLRTFARIDYTYASHAQLIRELFPKALFDEQNATYRIFMEIAWSFLSDENGFGKKWHVRLLLHRIGGLPAEIHTNILQIWFKDGKYHRDDKDPRTGFTLPAVIWSDGSLLWYKDGKCHRDDKDPKTGLTLPAQIDANGSRYWYKDGKQHRDDKDPRTGLTLRAVIRADGSYEWYNNGERYYIDED